MNPPAPVLSFIPATSRPLHILYATAQRESRELISRGFARERHHLETVGDGLEALARLTPALIAFDLLIADHEMPRLNGLELVRQLRQLAYPGKIIILGSGLTLAVHAQYRQLAVDLVLPKLIFPATLHLMLGQLFSAGSTEPWPGSGASQHAAALG